MEKIFESNEEEFFLKMEDIYEEVLEAYFDEVNDGIYQVSDEVREKALKIMYAVFSFTKQMGNSKKNTEYMLRQIHNILMTGEYKYLFVKNADVNLEEIEDIAYKILNREMKEELILAARWLEYYHRVYEKPMKAEGDNVFVEYALHIVEEEIDLEEKNREDKKSSVELPYPVHLYRYFEERVIGQPELKLLALAIHRYVNLGVRENNVVLIKGPTGCGKNYAMEVISEFTDIPVLTWDLSQNSPAGFTGYDLRDIINTYLKKCAAENKSPKKGIIFLNEADKIFQPNFDSHGDNVNALVQQQLLCALEGKSVIEGFDTRNVMFILGGAFEYLEEKKEQEKFGIGFGASGELKTEKKLSKSELRNSLINIGAERELMGRINTIVNMRKLEKEDIKKILLYPKTGIIRIKQDEFRKSYMLLEFTETAIDRIADEIVKEDLGARSAVNIVNELVDKYQFDMYEKGYIKMIVHEGMIDRGEPPKFEGGFVDGKSADEEKKKTRNK